MNLRGIIHFCCARVRGLRSFPCSMMLLPPMLAGMLLQAPSLVLADAGLEAGGAVVLKGTPPETSLELIGDLPNGFDPEQGLFEIGSITKVFVGMLLAQSVLDEEVSLDSTVAELLGEGLSFADPRVGEITLAELASHSSGLPRLPDNIAENFDPGDPYASYTEAMLLDYLSSAELPELGENGRFPTVYSNLGFGLLGYLLERKHGVPLEDLLKENIIAPLGMESTFLVVPGERVEDRLVPHAGADPVPFWHFDVLAGAGALWSTVFDLERFAACLLDPEASGFAEAVGLLKEERSRLGATAIGLGLMRETIWGKARYFHDGGTGGFSSFLMITPETGELLVVLANQASGAASRMANQVLGATGEGKSTGMSDAEPVPAGELDLTVYEGRYPTGTGAVFLVQAVGDELYVRLSGQLAVPLQAQGNHRFAYSAVEASITFIPDDEGHIQRLELFQNGRVLSAGDKQALGETRLLLGQGEAEAYRGQYELAPGQIMEVTAVDRQLVVQLTGQPALAVLPVAPDRFAYDVVEAEIAFQRDEAGSVTGLVLHQNGLEMPAPKK